MSQVVERALGEGPAPNMHLDGFGLAPISFLERDHMKGLKLLGPGWHHRAGELRRSTACQGARECARLSGGPAGRVNRTPEVA